MSVQLSNREINSLILSELYDSVFGRRPEPEMFEAASEAQQARAMSHLATKLEQKLTREAVKPTPGSVNDPRSYANRTGGTGDAYDNDFVQNHPNLFYPKPTGEQS